MKKLEQLALMREHFKRQARKSFKSFVRWMDGRKMPAHIELMCGELEDVVVGTRKKLCVSIPPGHGKSFCCNLFIAWLLGHNPDCRIITTSYSDRLVRRNCQAVQDIMRDPLYLELFPGTRIDGNQTLTSKEFHVRGRAGYLLAEAAGGQITGFRADVLVVDDPYKSLSSAKSDVVSDNLREWYDATFRTRGHEQTREIVIHTRWLPDDLIGWLRNREGDDWSNVVLPAIKEGTPWEHPADAREVGQALWPELVSLEELEKRQQQNAYVFSSLYQQRPTLAEGELLKVEWTSNRWWQLPEGGRWWQSFDLRNGGKGSNSSYAVGQLWYSLGPNAYLVDQVRGRWSFPETLSIMEELQSRELWCLASTILVEDKADGKSAIPMLKQKFAGIIPVNPKSSKEERLSTVTSYWASGNVLLPRDATWLSSYIDELTSFPRGANDDQVDCTTQVLEHIFMQPKFHFVI